jgi:hypothetical protein
MRRSHAGLLLIAMLVSGPGVVGAEAAPDRRHPPTISYYLQTDFDDWVGGGYDDVSQGAEFGCEGHCATGSFTIGGVGCRTGPKCGRVNHIDTETAEYEAFYGQNEPPCTGPPFVHHGIIDLVNIDQTNDQHAFVGLATLVTPTTMSQMYSDTQTIEVLAVSPTDQPAGRSGKVVQVRLQPVDSDSAVFGLAIFLPSGPHPKVFGDFQIEPNHWYYTVLEIERRQQANLNVWVYDDEDSDPDVEEHIFFDTPQDTTEGSNSRPRQKVGGENPLGNGWNDTGPNFYTFHDDWYIAHAAQNPGPMNLNTQGVSSCGDPD